MCATMIWPLHSAAVRFLHKKCVSEMKRTTGGLQWRQVFFWNVWHTKTIKDVNFYLNYSEKKKDQKRKWRWCPPYGSSRLHIRYQCIKLTYPGLYFATLSAEKQTIPPRPPQSHTATAESSDLASARPLWLVHFKVAGPGQIQHSCSSRWSLCLHWGVQSFTLFCIKSFHLSCSCC